MEYNLSKKDKKDKKDGALGSAGVSGQGAEGFALHPRDPKGWNAHGEKKWDLAQRRQREYEEKHQEVKFPSAPWVGSAAPSRATSSEMGLTVVAKKMINHVIFCIF